MAKRVDEEWIEESVLTLEFHGLWCETADHLMLHKITTIGRLAFWVMTDALPDIPGIDETKAEQINRAIKSFWASRSKPIGA